jgi:hypothetical protein
MAPCPGLTISTVGYGDQYPVTNAGRIIGTCIIEVGVGIFGTFTGYLANVFLGPAKRSGTADGDGDGDASDRLRALIARSEQTTAELRRLLPDVRDA